MRQTILVQVIAVLVLVLLAAPPPPRLVSGSTPGFDGGPLAVMLRDALENFYSGDYGAVVELASQALRIQVPQGLDYYHNRSWTVLRELAEYGLRALSGNTSAGREDLYRLYRLRLEAPSLLRGYAEALVHYVPNPPTKLVLRKILGGYLDRVEEKIGELVKAYEEHLEIRALRVHIEVSQEALAGRSVPVVLVFSEPVVVREVRVVLVTPTSSFAETIIANSGRETSTYNLSVPVPGTETGAYTGTTTRCRLIVAVTATTAENQTAYGAGGTSLVVKAIKPRILFRIPARVEPGGTLVVEARAHVTRPLNTTLRLLDRSGRIVAERNTTVQPGANLVELPVTNASRGVYTLAITIWPSGEYLGATYSKAILVAGKPVHATVAVPEVLIGPPFTATIAVNVSTSMTGRGYWVYVSTPDGTLLGLRGSRGGGQVALQVSLGWSLLFDSRELVIRVRPESPGYDEAVFRARIYMFNYLTLLVAIALALTVSSATAEGLTLLARPRGAALVAKKTRDPVVRLYYRLVEFLAAYYRAPRPSETLREYYSALARALGRGLAPLRVFFALYERYLYSRRKPFPEEARRAYREAVRWLRL